MWGLRKGLLCNTTQTTSLGVQNQDGEWYGLASGVHTGQDQGRRMSRLHSVSRILLETQAPIINTQWLSAVEHVKTHAQQKRIKALPLGHLLNLTKNARTLHYKRYEHDVVMAVFEATAWLQTCVSALPGGGLRYAAAAAQRRSFQCWWSRRVRGTPTLGNYKRAPGASSHNSPRRTISPNCVPKRRG